MPARKRPLQSSVQGRLAQTAALLAKKPEPPEPLEPLERAAFDKVVKARESALGFSDFELLLCVQLAKNSVLMNDLTERLKREGPVVMGGRNGTTPVANPLFQCRDSCSRVALGLTRMLGLTAPVDRTQLQRNAADNKARDVLQSAATSDEELI